MKRPVLLINFVKMCGDGGARAYDTNCISYNFHQLLSVYFYRTCCIEKYMVKSVHTFVGILIHFSFCVRNFVLPAHRPNFVQVASTT